ncbi:acyltransferase domain-containing protein, partial [bacterium]|nr:acyltransferase domain-containing protein [bacterium]
MKRYDIAIIGMGGVFPGANNVEQYWKNIISGDTYITDMPEKYFRKELYFSEGTRANDKSYTMKGAFINDFSFPYTKYKLPPKTMKEVDPAQLVALESTREALKDAGIKPRSKELDDAITVLGVSGVDGYAHATTYLRRNRYMDKLKIKLQEQGVSSSLLDKISKEFDAEVAKHHPLNMSTAATGMIPSAISNRVAQVFGVKGFNMTVDAACASSFSALEVSCLALMAGDTRIAITGGVDLGVNPAIYIGFSRVEGLSFSGISNPFDHTADGLVIGEGGGVVILKRLEDALADGDDIKAVIRGHGSSSDGSGQAIYAPSVVGRARALRSALDIAGVTAHDIQFLEAHATSTIVGDANEYDAISSVYSEGRNPKDPLFLGSVKYQIGHLKAAAGVAGLIKVVKGMMHKTIPHMPLFSGLTPKATMKSEGLVVPTKLQEWHQNSDGKMIGAITSSGFGGSNYHLIIEKADSYETPKRKTLVDRNIAIIGVSMKLPSATDEQTFWNNISEGKKIFKPANKDELHWTQHVNRGPENERIETEVVSTIDEYKFNSLRHKILPKAISQIAPTQLLSLVLADELLDKHGFDYKAPKNIGVSVGAIHDDFFPDVYDPMITDDYAACVKACDSFNSLSSTIATSAITQTKEWVTKDSPPITEHTLPGWMGNIVSGRIANKLNLQGANIVVDSACSSSMAALLPAIYQLQFNKVDMMISGGVNRQMSDVFTAGVNAIGALAKDDARPFDESGKGYVIGEGGVYYLLKTVEKAKKDGDTIIAIINSVDGSSEAESKSMVAPSEIAARRAIKRTMDKSTVAADSIGVVDTHGSANKLSDIVEVQSLAKELRSSTTDTPLHITAIKSHVGHIYGGSGATSMLSVIHSLKNRKVPGIRNLKNLRPEIEDVKNRACPVFKTTTLSDTTDAGGVISLGLGGANYFAVITLDDAATKVKTSTPPIVEPPKSTVISRRSDSTYDNGVFLCSADQESTLIDILSRTVTLDKIPSHIAKGDGSIRFSATYNNQEELKTKLNQTIKFFSAGHNLKPLESQGIFLADNSDRNEKLAFCFPGQGTHYISMGKFLYDSHPVFRDILDEIDALAKSELNFNLIDHIYGDPQSQQIKQNLATLTGAQISLFAVEVGVAKVMESLGVKPHVLIGHSFGEISALTFAGVWDIPTAFKVVKARIAAAQIAIDANDKPLGMMSIICSEEKRDALLKPLKGRIYLTNVNAPGRFIFAGEKELVQSTVELAEAFGIDATVLPIETAFHSPYMRPAQASFEQTLRQLPCNTPRFPILSTVNGEYINASHISSEGLAQHLSSQLVTTLNLPREITKLYDDGVKHYLEVGPGWSMTKMISSILKHHHFRAVPTLHPKIGDVEVFRRGKAFLAAAGHLKAEGEMRNLSNFISSDLLHFLRDHDSALLGQLGKVHTKFLQWKELHKIETVKPVLHQRPQATIETIAPVAAQKSALAVVAPPSGEASPEWIKRVKDELVEMTGYPADMLETNVDLEADLGIDSIQRAELWVIITKKYSLDETVKPTQPIKTILGLAATFGEIEAGNTPPPTEPTEAPAPVVTESALAVAAPPSGNASPEWIKRVKDELVEMTGYPADMLETNVDLEADLGIDSIQRAELWVIITKKYSLDETVKPTQPIKTILGLAATFGEIEAGNTPPPTEPTEAPAPV